MLLLLAVLLLRQRLPRFPPLCIDDILLSRSVRCNSFTVILFHETAATDPANNRRRCGRTFRPTHTQREREKLVVDVVDMI